MHHKRRLWGAGRVAVVSGLLLVGIVYLFALAAPAAAVPPDNDNFPGTTISYHSVAFTDSVDTTNATTETGEPTPCAGIGSTVWYSFTPSSDTHLAAYTFGSDFDTALAVYTGSTLSSLSSGDCNDNTEGSLQSRIVFEATGGVTYRFQVGGVSSESGNLVFYVDAGR